MIEIEHKAGTSMDSIESIEREIKKDLISNSLNIPREELDNLIDKAKDFFIFQEKEARKRGTTIFKRDDEDTDKNT